jgi:glutamine amidotransferase
VSATPTIAVVDYGMGNRRSVEKALEHVGARALITADHDAITRADGLVVPGVGAFPLAMERLNASGLADLVHARLADGVPVLGICLGLQLALDSSTEQDGAAGLGIVPGQVRELSAPGLKLPHIGWSMCAWQRPSELIEGLPDPCAFYHVHTFYPAPSDPQDVLGIADYGGPFVTAVQRGRFFGVQFHPEKSSTHGLRLLANFTSICTRARSAVPA